MNTLLVASVVVLWILVIALVVVVFALARQVGVLYERVAPAGALMVNQQIKAGDAAPQIAIKALNGAEHTTGVGNRRQLLFFIAPDCPICKSLLPVIKTLAQQEKDTTILLMSDGDDEQTHRDYVAKNGLERFDYAISEIVGRSFGVGKLPYGVLIDERGVVASLGIVNSREHLESLFEAERLGVASIQDYLEGPKAGAVETYEPNQPRTTG